MNRRLSRGLVAVRNACAAPHRRLVASIIARLSPRIPVREFELIAIGATPSPSAIKHLDEALGLIESADKGRWQRLRTDIRRFFIVPAGGPEYWPFANGVTLDHSFIETADSASVALVIVHEGTHARLWRRGHRYAPRERGRMEAICLSAEADFARRLGLDEDRVRKIFARLASEWWSEDAVVDRQHRARLSLWPEWLLRFGSRRRGRS